MGVSLFNGDCEGVEARIRAGRASQHRRPRKPLARVEGVSARDDLEEDGVQVLIRSIPDPAAER